MEIYVKRKCCNSKPYANVNANILYTHTPSYISTNKHTQNRKKSKEKKKKS